MSVAIWFHRYIGRDTVFGIITVVIYLARVNRFEEGESQMLVASYKLKLSVRYGGSLPCN